MRVYIQCEALTSDFVCEGVEIESACDAKGRHHFRRGDESVRCRVGVVAAREVAVV